MNCVHCYSNFYARKQFETAIFIWQGASLCELHYQAATNYEYPTDGKDDD